MERNRFWLGIARKRESLLAPGNPPERHFIWDPLPNIQTEDNSQIGCSPNNQNPHITRFRMFFFQRKRMSNNQIEKSFPNGCFSFLIKQPFSAFFLIWLFLRVGPRLRESETHQKNPNTGRKHRERNPLDSALGFRCRPDLPSGAFRVRRACGPAPLRATLSCPPTAGLQIIARAQLQKKAEPDGFRLFCKVPTGFEPVNNGFADRPLRPLGYSTIALECPITLPKRHNRCKYYSHLPIRAI